MIIFLILKLLQGGVGPQGAQGDTGRPGNTVKYNTPSVAEYVITLLHPASEIAS